MPGHHLLTTSLGQRVWVWEGEKPRGFPANPELWDRYVYVSPISGCTIVTWEWCGVAGWRFISDA